MAGGSLWPSTSTYHTIKSTNVTCPSNLYPYTWWGAKVACYNFLAPHHLQRCSVCDPAHSKIGWRVSSNVCRFGSGTWFWLSIITHCAMADKSKHCAPAEKSNDYVLTAAQCFWLVHHNDWSRWFVINSLPPICCPSFSIIGGVAKEYITKLGCEKYFHRVTNWAPLEILWGRPKSRQISQEL